MTFSSLQLSHTVLEILQTPFLMRRRRASRTSRQNRHLKKFVYSIDFDVEWSTGLDYFDLN